MPSLATVRYVSATFLMLPLQKGNTSQFPVSVSWDAVFRHSAERPAVMHHHELEPRTLSHSAWRYPYRCRVPTTERSAQGCRNVVLIAAHHLLPSHLLSSRIGQRARLHMPISVHHSTCGCQWDHTISVESCHCRRVRRRVAVRPSRSLWKVSCFTRTDVKARRSYGGTAWRLCENVAP